jgi:hypothetical protein
MQEGKNMGIMITLKKPTAESMVPLGEALALLPFSRHFPDAPALVTQIEAVQTAAETRPVRTSSA